MFLSELFSPHEKKLTRKSFAHSAQNDGKKNSVKASHLEPPRFDAIFFSVILRSQALIFSAQHFCLWMEFILHK
jgi:hypothetical protein